MTIFATGCTHFDHFGIMRMTGRPFNSAEELNETLIDNWNKTVTSNDTVIHVGDFVFHTDPKPFIKRLKGKIVLLRGNHDAKNWGEDYLEIDAVGRRWIMMHYPIEEWNGWFHGTLHLHCHTHKKELVSGVRRFNVGVDATSLTPISLDELALHPNANHIR